MNYSSAAERAIEAVNRLLIAAMTLAWTSALSHQHALPPQEEDGDADDGAGDDGGVNSSLTTCSPDSDHERLSLQARRRDALRRIKSSIQH